MRPNIVFVLMDNLGYGEVGVYGGGILRGAPTPRIDELAAQGFRLLNFLGESEKSNREGFPVFVADRLEAVKWRNWKVVFYENQRDWWSPPIKLGSPKAFDLITDPKEEYEDAAVRHTWNAGPAMKIVSDFEQSLREHPPIPPGTPDPYEPPHGG